MRRGNIYQIANGYMGYRGTLDEFGSEQLVGITLAGIFDRVGSAWREPVNAPNGGFTSVALDGVELSALGGKVARHRQTLRFANALFERDTVFASKGWPGTGRARNGPLPAVGRARPKQDVLGALVRIFIEAVSVRRHLTPGSR